MDAQSAVSLVTSEPDADSEAEAAVGTILERVVTSTNFLPSGRSGSCTHPLEFNSGVAGTGLENKKTQIITLNDSKAGMQGLDLPRINKIIAETSEGSKFYEHKRKIKQRSEQKALEMRKLYDQLSPAAVEESTRKMDKLAAQATRDDTKVIVHIDMDCFFAAVEMRDNPTLREKPMAVGCSSMLSTSNYIARKFGVRAAMPGFIAKKLCPNLVIIPPDFAKYSAASEIAANIYREYDPTCYSCMDEASLDITEYIDTHLTDDEDREVKITKTVQEIRERVCVVTNGLTCSAGISPVGFLSKICSDINKPNGQFRLKAEEVKEFLKNLKIRKVCGIGEATENLLSTLDIDTCGDIWERRGAINLLFKPATADFLFKVALGIGKHFISFPSSSSDNSAASSGGADDRKSISLERTFSETDNFEYLSELCQRLSTELAEDLVSKNCMGKAIAVKIKTDTFDVKTRIRTLLDYTCDASVIFKTAMSIFQTLRTEQEGMILRLFGVRISTLQFKNPDSGHPDGGRTNSKQLTLFQGSFHGSTVSKSKVLECPICQKQFFNSFSLRKHVDDCINASEIQSEQIAAANQETTSIVLHPQAIFPGDQDPPNLPVSNSAKPVFPEKCQVSPDGPPNIIEIPSSSFATDLPNKRIKLTSSEYATSGQAAAGTRQTKPNIKISTNIISKSKKCDSPMKMMPINFYFQSNSKSTK